MLKDSGTDSRGEYPIRNTSFSLALFDFPEETLFNRAGRESILNFSTNSLQAKMFQPVFLTANKS